MEGSTNPLVILNSILSNLDPFVPQAIGITKPLEGDSTPAGVTKDYCPVTMKKRNMLSKGDPFICAKFEGKLYNFVDEDARSNFCSQPYFYTKDCKVPPPRIIFIGPSGSRKVRIY